MIDFSELQHHIQKHIITVLMYQATARFSELRPPRTDTNLFSYHLKCLLRDGFIQKNEKEYTLSTKGLAYVDRVSTVTRSIRHQPKIISMLLIQNSDGQVLLQKRRKQPYTDTWTLPYGKVHNEDKSVLQAAQREIKEKLELPPQEVRHAGDCYIRVYIGDDLLSSTLAHIFRLEADEVPLDDARLWVDPLGLSAYSLAPAVEKIVARSFFDDDHFFAEFDCQWQVS